MLASYLDRAIEQAVYEIIEDEKVYWGEIPALQGVWARHATAVTKRIKCSTLCHSFGWEE